MNSLHKKFKEVVKNNFKRVSVIIDEKSITYKELDDYSDRVAFYLAKNKKIKTSDVVAISGEKSVDVIILIIACLKLGLCYCFYDNNQPQIRTKKIFDKIKPKFVFTEKKSKIKSNSKYKIISIHSLSQKFKNYPKYLDYSDISRDSPLYVMYTSGSTGSPKGSTISYRNIENFINWTKYDYKINNKDVVSNLNPLYFDNSVFDIYSSLFNGAKFLMVNKKLILDPKKLMIYLKKYKITIWFSVPTLILYCLKFVEFNKNLLPSLRAIIFGGEAFPKKELRGLFYKLGRKVSLYNVYGPSECTCICSNYKISSFDFNSKEINRYAPFGKKLIQNFKYIIWNNEKNREIEKKEIGELLIGGENVGLGYFNEPELNKKCFIQNPKHLQYNDIYYTSGDLVYKENGLIYFAGRKDDQIKFNGYRIELAEIENAMNSLKFVRQSIATFGKKNNKYQITAWILTIWPKKNLETVILNKLKNKLPYYMIPKIKFIKKFELNANGKINRKKISEKYYDKK